MMNDRLPAGRRLPTRTAVVALLSPLLLILGLSLFGMVPGCSAILPPSSELSGVSGLGLFPPGQIELTDGEPKFFRAERDGMKGGCLIYDLPGRVDDVVAMLLDFDHAEKHRSWASEYQVVERGDDRVLAEWHFHGRFGIGPRVQIQFATFHEGPTAGVNFALRKSALGMAGFRGNHSLAPLPGDQPRVRVQSTVFIDSGLFFANASHEDIEKGLRADAKLMLEWMEERLAMEHDSVTEH